MNAIEMSKITKAFITSCDEVIGELLFKKPYHIKTGCILHEFSIPNNEMIIGFYGFQNGAYIQSLGLILYKSPNSEEFNQNPETNNVLN